MSFTEDTGPEHLLVEMLFWPVNVSFGLPEWQAVEITFFEP